MKCIKINTDSFKASDFSNKKIVKVIIDEDVIVKNNQLKVIKGSDSFITLFYKEEGR